MHLKSENITVITGYRSNKNTLIKTIFNSPFIEYQNSLLKKMKGGDFVLGCIDKI